MVNRMSEHLATESLLGLYLRDRRMKLDPAAFGFPPERRRTPGLRREQVAQRASSTRWIRTARLFGRRSGTWSPGIGRPPKVGKFSTN